MEAPQRSAHLRGIRTDKNYESLQRTNRVKDADQNGLAVIHLYSNSRVRVFAEQLVDNAKENGLDTRYSRFVESEASKMPGKIDLVLTSAKP